MLTSGVVSIALSPSSSSFSTTPNDGSLPFVAVFIGVVGLVSYPHSYPLFSTSIRRRAVNNLFLNL